LHGFNVFIEKKANKQLQKLDKDTNKRVIEALCTLRDEGFSTSLDIKKLKGYKTQYRIRIGKYRILFEVDKEETIVVHAILPRETAY